MLHRKEMVALFWQVEGVLIKAGIPRPEAPGIIENMWSDGTALEYTQPVDEDVEQLFNILKQQGIKIAVYTSSTREFTIRSMKKIRLDCHRQFSLFSR